MSVWNNSVMVIVLKLNMNRIIVPHMIITCIYISLCSIVINWKLSFQPIDKFSLATGQSQRADFKKNGGGGGAPFVSWWGGNKTTNGAVWRFIVSTLNTDLRSDPISSISSRPPSQCRRGWLSRRNARNGACSWHRCPGAFRGRDRGLSICGGESLPGLNSARSVGHRSHSQGLGLKSRTWKNTIPFTVS